MSFSDTHNNFLTKSIIFIILLIYKIMSLSRDGIFDNVIAIITDKKKQKKGFIYYDKDNIDKLDGLTIEDIDDEILKFHYGNRAFNRKNKTKLKLDLIDKVKELNNSDKRFLKQIRADDNELFFPLPLTNPYKERDAWYITGQSGSGKSSFIMRLVYYYHSLGINKIYVISSKDGDKENFLKLGVKSYLDVDDLVENVSNKEYYDQLQQYKEKKLKFKHLKKNLDLDIDEAIEMEIEIEKMKPNNTIKSKTQSFKPTNKYKELTDGQSLFIFDDYETLSPAEKLMKAQWLINYILINERSRNVNIIIVNHKTTNGLSTSHQLNESQKFVIFQRNLFKSYHYLLKKYIGLSNNEIQRVRAILKNSKYIMIDRLNKYVVSEHLIYLL